MSKKDCQNKADRLLDEYLENEDPAIALKASYYCLMAEDYAKNGRIFVGLLHNVDKRNKKYEILISQWKKYRDQIEFLAHAFYHEDNRAIAENIFIILRRDMRDYQALSKHSNLLNLDSTTKIISELLKRGKEGRINQILIGDDGIDATAWYVSADLNECLAAFKLLNK